MLRHDITSVPEDEKGRGGITYYEGKRAGFEEGRMFRAFYEINLAGSATHTFQIVVPVNTVLFGLELSIDIGYLKLETIAGGTPSGTFDQALTAIPQNNMPSRPSPFYVAQNTVVGGGSVTGGTLIDVIRIKSESNSGKSSSVGNVGGDERGVAPGTYYFRLTNLDTTPSVLGTLKLRWEERP